MIEIFGPEDFKEIPWKNGKGSTLELAISEGDSVQSFDWRISIALMDEDGSFSDFTGYQRSLVILEGNGIVLEHATGHSQKMMGDLPCADFDGSWQTYGKLIDGPITDFNVVTKSHRYQAQLHTYKTPRKVDILKELFCFAYSHRTTLTLTQGIGEDEYSLPAGHLLKIENPKAGEWSLSGECFILVYLAGL